MVSTLTSFGALYTAVLLLMMGVGLLGTQLSLRMAVEGFSAQMAGLVLAAYYLGLVMGSFFCRHLIHRVGHIRAFAAFAAVTTAIVMLHALRISPLAWGILRFLTGITTMGLYMVIESWLNQCTDGRCRGRVFSIYMLLAYLGLAAGQQLLKLADIRTQELFFVTGFLLALCLVPVAATPSMHPLLPKPERFSVVAIFRRAPLGLVGCLAAGLLNSAFYTMGPILGHQLGMSVSELSWFMSAGIFGGLIFQWPVGMISDRVDRTKMLMLHGVLISVVSAFIMVIAGNSLVSLCIAVGIFGGLAFTVYPVSVARTHDLFDAQDIVPVSSVLLLCFGIGASIGPVASSSLMTYMQSPHGLFVYASTIGALFALITLIFRRRGKIEIVPAEKQSDFLPMGSTSPLAVFIDPRVEFEVKEPSHRN